MARLARQFLLLDSFIFFGHNKDRTIANKRFNMLQLLKPGLCSLARAFTQARWAKRPRTNPQVVLLIATALLATGSFLSRAAEWQDLFDGKTLHGWKVTDFAGHGEVNVEGGQLRLQAGVMLTGVSWTNALPKIDYEVALDAMKVDGGDFFCGLTFPVQDSYCTLIVGGWGGGVVGLSSIDGLDASENETTKYMKFDAGVWHKIRLRVTRELIQAWIDEEKIVDQSIAGRRISLRPGDIDLSVPFGVATWQTTGALRDVKIRPISASGPEPAARSAAPLKALFLTGGGYHDYKKLAPHLTSSLSKLVNAQFTTAFDLNALTNAQFADPYDVVVYDVCFDDAPDAILEGALQTTRNGKPAVMIHCAVHAFRQSAKVHEWETCCGMRSKVHDPYGPFTVVKLDQNDPITKFFPAEWKTPGDELYQTISIEPQSHRLLEATSPRDGRTHTVGWTYQFGRGRVFATTLGHDMKTAGSPEYLQLLANGLLWACGKLGDDGKALAGYAATGTP
jgi:type 1 glutamine amidotransferase